MNKPTETENRLLCPKEVARFLGINVETLNIWRSTQRYKLPYIKVGRLVRYHFSDVITFAEENTVHPSS